MIFDWDNTRTIPKSWAPKQERYREMTPEEKERAAKILEVLRSIVKRETAK